MAARATKGFECNECTDCIRLMPSANGLTMGHSKLMLDGTQECTQECEGKNANGTVCVYPADMSQASQCNSLRMAKCSWLNEMARNASDTVRDRINWNFEGVCYEDSCSFVWSFTLDETVSWELSVLCAPCTFTVDDWIGFFERHLSKCVTHSGLTKCDLLNGTKDNSDAVLYRNASFVSVLQAINP